MKRLRTAVVGLGRIGWKFHAPEIVKHAGFELAAVVDPLTERLAEAKTLWGVKGYTQYESLLAGEKLDLIVVASPTPFHADQAIAAFGHGVDVFCDKPMAPSLAEADRMIRAAAEAGRKLMVYQPHRAGADIVGLKSILAQGLIGDVFMIKRASAWYARRNDWQAFRKNGGGMLNNYGAHYVDQLLHLAQSPAKRITCALRAVATLGDADDVVKAVIETGSGVVLDLDINMAAAHPIQPWLIFGRRGSIVLDETADAWRVRYFQEADLAPVAVQQGLAAEERRYGSGETIPWKEVVLPLSTFKPVDFYEQCYGYFALGQEPFVPVAETREVMRVLDACRRDAGWSA